MISASAFLEPLRRRGLAHQPMSFLLSLAKASCFALLICCASCGRPSLRDQLFMAAERGDTNEVIRLMARGVPVDSTLPSPPHSTVLIHSLRFRQHEVAVVLLNAGANPNLADVAGFGPLHYALLEEVDTSAAIEFLIKKGADPERVKGFVTSLSQDDPKRLAFEKAILLR